MENYIENRPNWFKKIGSKFLAVLSILMIGIVMMLCLSTTANAATNIPTGGNQSLYNDKKWKQASVAFYSKHKKFMGIDKTFHYIQIKTEDKSEFINDITRLEAGFFIADSGTEIYRHIVKENSGNTSGIFKSENVLSKDGELFPCTDEVNKANEGKIFEKYDATTNTTTQSLYEKCNYQWTWNWYVTKCIYLYVWYIDPTTGEETAASFFEDGAHPLYNEDGSLKGIFNSNNEIIENKTLNKYGIPSTIVKNDDGTTTLIPDLGWNSQEIGTIVVEDPVKKWWDDLVPGTGDDGNKGVLYYVVLIIKLIIYLLIIAAIFKIISFIIGLFKNK